MSKLLLNKNADGSDVTLDEGQIVRVYTANSVSQVEYIHDEDGYRRTVGVKETLANISGMSSKLVGIADENGTTVYINKDRVRDVYDESSKGRVLLEADGTNLAKIKSNDTAVDIKTAIFTKEGKTTYDTDSFTNSPDKVILDASHGDVTGNFTAGVVFTVYGEGNDNDTIYSTVSSSFNGSETEITVNETPAVVGAGAGKVVL